MCLDRSKYISLSVLRVYLGVRDALFQNPWKHSISEYVCLQVDQVQDKPDNSRGQLGVQIQCLGPPDVPLT